MHFTKTIKIKSTIKGNYNNEKETIKRPLMTKGDVRKEQPLPRRQQRVTPT